MDGQEEATSGLDNSEMTGIMFISNKQQATSNKQQATSNKPGSGGRHAD
jgi:hypothetical protein